MNSNYLLKNKYLMLRHGESEANRNGIIVSSPAMGLNEYGLTGQGVSDVAEVALQTYLDSTVRILCSDFLRTKQTANIVADVLDAQTPVQTELLRERFFGDLEGSNVTNYETVWQNDVKNIYTENVESIQSVLLRTLSCIWSIEEQYSGETILLVSHGDCLQIMSAWLKGLEANMHRTIAPIHTGKIRSLTCQRSLSEIQRLLNLSVNQAA